MCLSPFRLPFLVFGMASILRKHSWIGLATETVDIHWKIDLYIFQNWFIQLFQNLKCLSWFCSIFSIEKQFHLLLDENGMSACEHTAGGWTCYHSYGHMYIGIHFNMLQSNVSAYKCAVMAEARMPSKRGIGFANANLIKL